VKKLKCIAVMGTRPEAIKMAPVLREFRKYSNVDLFVVSTAQHRQMLDQVLNLFDIIPDADLDVMQPRQNLSDIVSRTLQRLDPILKEQVPDMLFVQGDTTTAFAAALSAFHRGIPVGHIEAGLRSYDSLNPFPEEMNRRLISGIATFHFAPTEQSADNLRREGVKSDRIFVTGNTVIDALQQVLSERRNLLEPYLPAGFTGNGHRLLLVTAHRRENWNGPLSQLCEALRELARKLPELRILFPVHLNPKVREIVFPALSNVPNIALTDPLPYGAFVEAMAASDLILTDSGGVQEEAPSLGKPVLVFRETTERPEGMALNAARLVGTQRSEIVQGALKLLCDEKEYRRMIATENPYGDGLAAHRIVQAVLHHFGQSSRPQPFRPAEILLLQEIPLRSAAASA
jgi:UDP-N-acetylglucosamine 2-epimerase (non-hydrolysing)